MTAPRFDIVVADPPWPYDFAQSKSRNLDRHYKTMTMEEIFTVRDSLDLVMAKDAVLFLWVTRTKQFEGVDTVRAWKWKYLTKRTWIKNKIGIGYWTRDKSEDVFISKRGTMKPPPTHLREPSIFWADEPDFDEWINAEQELIEAGRGKHSKKPPELQNWIDQVWPDARKLELFAREHRPGWTCLGLELDGLDINESLRRLRAP